MKRRFIAQICFVLLFVVVGCNSNEASNSANSNKQTVSIQFPEQIQTMGTMNGNRYFEFKGTKLFGGTIFYNAQTFSPRGRCVVSKMINGQEKFGVIDSKGNTIIDFKYDQLSSGILEVQGFYQFRDNETKFVGLIDAKGKEIIPALYAELGNIVVDGCLKARKEYDKWGVITTTNKVIVPLEYQFVSAFSDNRVKVRKNRNGNYGFFDQKGQLIIPEIFKESTDFQEKIAFAKQNGKYGIIDLSGKSITGFIYDNYLELLSVREDEISETGYSQSLMGCILPGGFIGVQQNGKWGYIDLKGNVVIPIEYDKIWEPEPDNRVSLIKDGKRGAFDLNTRKVTFY